MKNINKIFSILVLSTLLFVGCDKLLDVDSDRQVFPDEYNFTSSNDTLYSMFGLLSQLEKIADSYVILGELRGDLMDISDKSSLYLKEINNFNVSTPNNPYANIRDYYAVINNCNYIIHNIDTSVVKAAKKVMLKEYAACKAIRAWTYMQTALNFGSAIYYEKPILTIADAEEIQHQAPKTLEELVPLLIADIEPYKDINKPTLGTLRDYNTKYSYFPIRILLGDMYLWTNQYEKAAQEYYDMITKNNLIIPSYNFVTNWRVENSALTTSITNNGVEDMLSLSSSEFITNIASTNEYSKHFELDSLTNNSTLTPSSIALNNWNTQMYFYNDTVTRLGDLRKIGSVDTKTYLSYIDYFTPNINGFYINKYLLLNPEKYLKTSVKQIVIYRNALLYLRFAEALNRMGKPNTAFAILKHGLNNTNQLNSKIIPNYEKILTIREIIIKSKLNPTIDSIKFDTTYVVPAYMNFSNINFTSNIGIRMRGLGRVNQDTTYYIIPKLTTKTDSILYVEDKIQEELALETAFEGNRFHDLMRFAIRRNNEAYLADKIAAKHINNAASIKSKLMIKQNWYLPKK